MTVYLVKDYPLTQEISKSDILEKIQLNDLKNKSVVLNKGKILIPNIKEIQQKLEDLGYTEFDDYILEEYYDKKLVVIYGNCHTTAITDLLLQCEEFCKKYAIYRIIPVCDIHSPKYFDHPVFRNCDVFLHQSIRRQNRYGEKYASEYVIKKLKTDCKVIAIPNVYHLPMCFFPQYMEKKEFKLYTQRTIFFRDGLIDEIFSRGGNIGQIYKKYLDEHLYSDEELQEKFDLFIDKVKMREKDWDIKVCDFILENYQKHQLFYDPNHPTVYFFKYIVKECLKLLSIEYDENGIDKLEAIPFESYEMPICACVKSYFNMTYPDKILRKYGIKLKNEPMDLKSYIKQYIAYEWQNEELSKMKRIKSLLYFMRMGGTKQTIDRVIKHFKFRFQKKLQK